MSDSPCYRPNVAYYFQSAREKRARHRGIRSRGEAEVPAASDGFREDAANKYGATVHFPRHRPGALI